MRGSSTFATDGTSLRDYPKRIECGNHPSFLVELFVVFLCSFFSLFPLTFLYLQRHFFRIRSLNILFSVSAGRQTNLDSSGDLFSSCFELPSPFYCPTPPSSPQYTPRGPSMDCLTSTCLLDASEKLSQRTAASKALGGDHEAGDPLRVGPAPDSSSNSRVDLWFKVDTLSWKLRSEQEPTEKSAGECRTFPCLRTMDSPNRAKTDAYRYLKIDSDQVRKPRVFRTKTLNVGSL